jgi:hypothetical protein
MSALIAFITELIAELEALFAKNAANKKVQCCDCSSILAYSIPVETLQKAAENGMSIQDVLKVAIAANTTAAGNTP